MNPLAISEKEFKLFRDLIYDSAGISMAESKKQLIASRLSSRLRYYQFSKFIEYYNFITSEDQNQEKQIFIDLLTTNETSFFREPVHFEFLKNEILKNFDRKRIFRVWCAACSSGEEPYTMSMVLSDTLGENKWEIIASDISSRILEKSRQGMYPIEKAKQIPPNYLKKYCLRGKGSKEGYFKISTMIRSKINFLYVNLIEPLPNLGKFDLILLRNVMIYFDQTTRKSLVEKLVPLIHEKGYLFIGHAETLLNITDSLKSIRPAIYRKV
ncbi:MAG: protein-glutamate O-methyltransferase CheR [Leptospiraceae bacterium]|nr:protein-glutamate O-methyltransferase CheR [Leptospiraceae bacterium]MCP5497579.1 protein-glutamate O-methyltransferase CheR [Leptospiraceae bacterium]